MSTVVGPLFALPTEALDVYCREMSTIVGNMA